MRRVRSLLALLLALVLLLLPCAASATTCIALPALKPINRIWGVVFFPNGDRIAHAKVSVLQADKEVAVQETTEDGKFAFDQLKAGKYEIRILVGSIPIAGTEVVLVHPQAKPKLEIAVNMMPTGCSAFSLVNPKKFEAELN